MLSENPHISIVLDQLLDMKGQELTAVPITIVAKGKELDSMSFWDLALKVRTKKMLLIGWRVGEAEDDDNCGANDAQLLVHQIGVNPTDKKAKRAWADTDLLLVLAPFGCPEAIVFDA